MAKAGVALNSVLSTVSDTASAVSGIVNTVSNTMDIANAFVRHHQVKQRYDHKLDMLDYKEKRLEEIAITTAERKKNIGEICKDPTVQEYYNEAYTKLKDALAEEA